MVRALLTPPTGQAAAPCLQRLRRTAAACRAGPVLALLAASPGPPRPAAEAFGTFMLRARERALRAGTRPRAEETIETALATVRDLGRFMDGDLGKRDWALVDVHDIEAFLATLPKARKRRLTVLGQFFRFARTQKVMLVDPTRGLSARQPAGFTGQTVLLERQRELFRRWTAGPDAHPHESLLGILALVHAVSSLEIRGLRVDDIDHGARTVQLGKRPRPVPLDPASWDILQRCLAHRDAQATDNPHVMVTRVTRART